MRSRSSWAGGTERKKRETDKHGRGLRNRKETWSDKISVRPLLGADRSGNWELRWSTED